jgi:hypothetical protein
MTILYNITTQEVLSFHPNGYWVDGKKPELPSNIKELEVIYDERPIPIPTQKVVETWTATETQWIQSFSLVDKTEQEIEEDRIAAIPPYITRRQLKVGMITILNLDPDTIETMILQIEDETERKIALINWNDSGFIEIDHPMVLSFATELNLTQRQLEDFFTEANKI